MELVCWLGLVIGAAPWTPAADDSRPITDPSWRVSVFPDNPAGRSGEKCNNIADIEQWRWLSQRERWARGGKGRCPNTRCWMDMTTLYVEPLCHRFEIERQACYCFTWGWERLTGYGQGFGPFRIGITHPNDFAEPLLESLRIRTSDHSPREKARRIARLVKPWMTYVQLHALFGESEAVVYGHASCAPFGRVVYADYGVLVEQGKTGGLVATPQPMGDDGLAPWECQKILDELAGIESPYYYCPY